MFSLRKFKNTFMGELSYKAVLKFNENKGTYERVVSRTNTQEKDFQAHLDGEEHLCILNHMRGNYVKFMCVEVNERLTQEDASKLKERIPESIRKLFHIMKVGKYKYSLFGFFDEKIEVKSAVKFCSYIASLLPYKTSTKPLQNHIDYMLNDLGSALILPFFGNEHSYIWNGKPHDINFFMERIDTHLLPKELVVNYDVDYHSKEFMDGPPCLQSLTHHSRRVREDEGKSFLKQASGYLRRKGIDVYNGLLNYNSYFLDNPLLERDIKIKDGIKNYICGDNTISKHCNPYECAKREFGITYYEYTHTMDGLTVVSRDKNDDVYFFTINGIRVGPIGLDTITNPGKLSSFLIQKYQFVSKFNTDDLNRKLVDLFNNATLVVSEKGKDSSMERTKTAFMENLLEFYDNATVSTKRIDLEKAGNMIYDDGVYYYFKQELLKKNSGFTEGMGIRQWKTLIDSLGIFEQKILHVDGPKVRRYVYKVEIEKLKEILKTI